MVETTDKDRLIIRQTSVKASARIVSAKGGKLFEIAEKIEKWITR